MYAKGHHSYPQPEDTWDVDSFESVCLRCGIRGKQVAPLRVKGSRAAPHSDITQLNWLFDVFLAKPDALNVLSKAELTGFDSAPLLVHKTGETYQDRAQLRVQNEIACIETSLLPTVTCRRCNEESSYDSFGGTKRYPASTPYCGAVKFHPPTSVSIHSSAILGAPDIFISREWFGSGGGAFRLTLCSERFVEIFANAGFRGASFKPVSLDGVSKRET